jgi:acetyl esterase/lipase
MLIPWLFLAAAVIGGWFTLNAFRPVFAAPRFAIVSFFAGWLTGELALHHVLWQLLATVAFVWAGALQAWPGWLALAITLVSWAGLARVWLGARVAEGVCEGALCEGLGAAYRDDIRRDLTERFASGVDWRQLAMPFPLRHPEVERVKGLVYAEVGGRPLRLDVYRRRDRPAGCPTLLQIHGGAWILGSKDHQGLPLMLHMAARGWVCVAANYRLSPRATFPDHLVDLKRAIKWIREHGPEYRADPDFLVVTGGSAGGHLAAMVALTANDPEYQPGFEDVDTSVRACVPFYGVYDFTDRHKHQPHRGLADLLERRVMKKKLADAPDAYEKASPIARVHPGAPPFFIVHGDRDTLVPVAEARAFAKALREQGGAEVVYAEIPGAQHAFEIFPSLRTTFVVHAVERFLARLWSRHVRTGDATDAAGGRAVG